MSRAGDFVIEVSRGGYPVFCELSYRGNAVLPVSFGHKELSDLQYAVEKAIQEARLALPPDRRDEVLVR